MIVYEKNNLTGQYILLYMTYDLLSMHGIKDKSLWELDTEICH